MHLIPSYILDSLRGKPYKVEFKKTKNRDVSIKFKGFINISNNIGIYCHFGTKFLWWPRKIKNKWYWLKTVWVKLNSTSLYICYNYSHDYNYSREYMLMEDFILYKFLYDLEPSSEKL